jgi:hypothetical protein
VAVWRMEKRAEDMMGVCVASRCVSFGRRGRRESKVVEGRMVHSWKLRVWECGGEEGGRCRGLR